MFRLIFISVIFLLISCNTNIDVPEGDSLWYCTNKQDNSLDIKFLKSKSYKYVYEAYDIDIMMITDVKGKKWSVNEDELQNYECKDITQSVSQDK